MEWFTRAIVSKKDIVTNRLFDNYSWHKAVWKCFPDASPTAKRDFLSRIVKTPDGLCMLYVLSKKEPTRPNWCADKKSFWQSREIPAKFLEYPTYTFDLLANPTRRIVLDGRCPRIFLSTEEEQRNWLIAKGKRHGFALSSDKPLLIHPSDTYLALKRSTLITHVGVRFQGTLTVTDRDLFKEAFYQGIGSAKSFHFGLLLLRPVSSDVGMNLPSE